MNVIPFSFKEKQVRVVDVNGEAWFVAADVAAVLGYSNPMMQFQSTARV